MNWRDKAACKAAPGLFFGPESETRGEKDRRERKAKAVCAGCTVWRECLMDAIGYRPARFGVWGGTGEDERKELRERYLGRVRARAAGGAR